MDFLKKLLTKKEKVRILRCAECGEILPKHTNWCDKNKQPRRGSALCTSRRFSAHSKARRARCRRDSVGDDSSRLASHPICFAASDAGHAL